jgi:hypothetical protein
LVSSSDTVIAMSSPRSAVRQRRRVAMVKSRAARTDPASAPTVRVAIRGRPAHPASAGSGDGSRLPYARPAISAATISQRKPPAPAGGVRPVSRR